jgi:hypothetical protein
MNWRLIMDDIKLPPTSNVQKLINFKMCALADLKDKGNSVANVATMIAFLADKEKVAKYLPEAAKWAAEKILELRKRPEFKDADNETIAAYCVARIEDIRTTGETKKALEQE